MVHKLSGIDGVCGGLHSGERTAVSSCAPNSQWGMPSGASTSSSNRTPHACMQRRMVFPCPGAGEGAVRGFRQLRVWLLHWPSAVAQWDHCEPKGHSTG
jgi:hypothetical protein